MNKLVKILIIFDVVFCVLNFYLMALGVLNISASDIAVIGSVIMSPELFVAINKCCEKFQKTEEKKEEKQEAETEEKKEENTEEESK